jgi:hypothetical protein
MRLDWFRKRPAAVDAPPPPEAPWRGATSPAPRPYPLHASADADLAAALAASAAEAAADEEAAAVAAATALSLTATAGAAARADALSYKLFDTDCLDYGDAVCDGVYDVRGAFGGGGRGGGGAHFPSLAALRALALDPGDSRLAVVVDFGADPALGAVDAAAAAALAAAAADGPAACVRALARVVCEALGGPGTHAELAARERAALASPAAAAARVGATLPLGALVAARAGSSRHRALLFKALADACDLPCRLLRGTFYAGGAAGGADGGDVAVVHVALGGCEAVVDLAACPASTWTADQPGPGASRSAAPASPPCGERGGALAPPATAFASPASPAAPLRAARSSGEELIDLTDGRPATPAAPGGGASPRPASAAGGGARAGAGGFESSAFAPAPADRLPPPPAVSARERALAAGLAVADPFVGLSPFAAAESRARGAPPRPPRSPRDAVPSLADLAARVPVTVPANRAAASAFYEFGGQGSGGVAQSSAALSAAASSSSALPDPLPPLRNEPPRARLAGAVSAPAHPSEKAAAAATASASSSAPPLDPDDAADPYEIDPAELAVGPRIGIGSFGEVYRGTWRRTDVAVKRLLDSELGDAGIADFRREIALLRRLKHPNVVQFLGAVSRPPHMCVVTQLAPRGSLFRLLHRPPPGTVPVKLADRTRARMALDVARGVHYLHSCRPPILHRDLKSLNVLVGADLSLRLCDFGLARVRAAAGGGAAPSRAATAEYSAPEAIRGEAASEACDAWAFGVVLWELFTGAEPWAETPAVTVVAAVGFGGATLPLPPTLPPAIAATIRDCWAADPGARPDFGALCDRLTAYLRATPPPARGDAGGARPAPAE